MSGLFRFLPTVLLVLYLIFKFMPSLPLSPGEYSPTPQQKAQLQEVKAVLAAYPDASEDLSHMFNGLALVVNSDSAILKTTGDVRRTHQNAGALAIQVSEIPRIPGYAEAVDSFLNADIGADNVPLDAVKRKQVVDAFKALNWATQK